MVCLIVLVIIVLFLVVWESFDLVFLLVVTGKGVWWMPWQTRPMKDVVGCDKPRGVAERALIRGCPNGGTRYLLWGSTTCCGGYAGK